MKEINIRFCYKIFGQISYISPLESETLFSIMRKSLLSVVFLMGSLVSSVNAQEDLFKAPDSVCVKQTIQLVSNFPDKQSHYWGFCSGYLYNKPTGVRMTDLELDGPAGIEVARNDDGNYFGFAINPGNRTFVRLNFGTSLSNTPVVTNFGNMDGIFPDGVNSMYMVRDMADKRWYIFITAGSNPSTSTLARIDFGTSLANTPNIVNFGNLENKLNIPTGVFVAKEGDKWYGFLVNNGLTELLRFNLDTNISLTPTLTQVLYAPQILSGPTDIGAIIDDGKWYFFVTNSGNSSISRIDMGTLDNVTPAATTISNSLVDMGTPSSITLLRDCGRMYAFVTAKSGHSLVRIEMQTAEGPYTSTDFSNLGSGQILSPTHISKVIRDRDNVYAFVSNEASNSITRVNFEQCNTASIQYSLTNRPPEYKYTDTGLFNIYYAVNEGLPDMQVQCKLIRVLPTPALIISDDTTICQGDTAELTVTSINAISYSWTPNYNISSPDKKDIKIWPDVTTGYTLRMPFPLGSCVVDTTITVNVKKLKADAGPDRTIADGASTMLGGPMTSQRFDYLRKWMPDQYIDDVYNDNPTVSPPHDFTYYLSVTDSSGMCTVTDTVVVFVQCDDMDLPNAFMPESGGSRSQFGLMNRQIAKLDKFNIYDRWGKLVFTTTDITKQWDGMIAGEKAAVGVYVWEVDAFCLSGRRINKTGNVMLIR